MTPRFHSKAPPCCGAFFCPGLYRLRAAGVLLLLGTLGVTRALAEQEAVQRIGPYVMGERLYYSVSWGPLNVGEGVFATTMEEDEELGSLIRLRFTSRSQGLADKIYKVDDTIDSFIHPVTLRPVKVEKKTQEGDFFCDSTLSFDFDQMEVSWEDRIGEQAVTNDITETTTDFYSLLYRLRSMDFEKGTNTLLVVEDDKAHELQVSAGETDTRKVKSLGRVTCRNILIDSVTEGLFVRKVPSDVWVTTEEPRILAHMKVKVPVGSVKVRFKRREIEEPKEVKIEVSTE